MFALFLVGVLFTGVNARGDALEVLKDTLEKRVSNVNMDSRELVEAASYDRIRKWLPKAPQVNYWNNDSNTWKAWTIQTSVPYPRAFLRDNVEASEKDYLQASAKSNKQDQFRTTLSIFLDCAIPSELEGLMRSARDDQASVAGVLDMLYSFGKSPQSDRVAAQLTLRQLEAQVKMYEAQSRASCERWENWAGISTDTEDPKFVPEDIDNAFLVKIGLEKDRFRDMTNKKLVNISMGRDNLWTKFIPDLEFTWSKNNYFDLIASGGPPRKFTTSWSVGMTLPIAFPFFEHTDYKREKAELGISRMQAEREKTESEKNWQTAKDDWKRITARLNQIWKEDSAVTEVLVESTLQAYRNGKSGFAELALARRTRLDLKIEEIQLKAERLVAKTICLTECDR